MSRVKNTASGKRIIVENNGLIMYNFCVITMKRICRRKRISQGAVSGTGIRE